MTLSDESQNVRVVVRCRPLNKDEVESRFVSVIDVDEVAGRVVARNPNAAAGEPPKEFTFDAAFAQNSKQMDVYNYAARPIADNVLEGYNGTIFAYGQTGTGKTYTMEGERTVSEKKGIIPNSFAHIFGHIAKSGDDKTFLVRVSYLEIYNEEIHDLLAKNHSHHLEIKERPDIGVYVKDLSGVTVGSADEMDKVMSIGNKHRSVGQTDMNEKSSRSHAIFSVTVECSELGPDKQQHVRVGKLHLVDLAGSERQSKTGATGMRLKEATKINLSLSTLGNVISALVDNKASHIPYRNSKLTRLLMDSLGGNSKTVMIANVGPADYNYDESISTLRYAHRAKSIKNHAKINEDPKDALLRKFQEEIEELRKQLAENGEEGEEEEGEEESGDEAAVEGVGGKRKKRKKLSEEKMKEIEMEIERDRAALEGQKDLEDGDRQRLQAELDKREQDLAIAREEHDILKKKLVQIEKKVIVGGENLLEKAEEQARLLEESRIELEQRRAKEEELRRALEQKQAERLDIEEKYSSLQDEASGKTKKLKKVWTMLMSAKAEMNDLQAERQREMEGLLDSVRQLSRELRLQMLIIDSFIPTHYQEMIERYVSWNEEIGDWQLKCVAYTGNNMRKQEEDPMESEGMDGDQKLPPMDLSAAYFSYQNEGAGRLRLEGKQKPSRKGGKKERNEAQLKALLH